MKNNTALVIICVNITDMKNMGIECISLEELLEKADSILSLKSGSN